MTDSAYINPSDREKMLSVINLAEPAGLRTKADLGMALKSHAVVDSIAAELAEALRAMCNDVLTCEESAHPCLAYSKEKLYHKHPALARFDNLTKGTE